MEELINNGITPYVVFDGADLPNKQITDDSRKLLLFLSLLISRRRDEALSRAQELEQSGNVTEARSEYYKALEITPELYVPLIKRLTLMGIQYIVAPYEADAELGYLYRNNFVDFVITEDGDSLVYGCRCVLFKLDNGVGDEIDVSRLNECTSMDFCGWTHDMFTYMCILSGCDYLPSLYGIGIKTAYTLVNLAKRPDAIFDLLRQKTSVPDRYLLLSPSLQLRRRLHARRVHLPPPDGHRPPLAGHRPADALHARRRCHGQAIPRACAALRAGCEGGHGAAAPHHASAAGGGAGGDGGGAVADTGGCAGAVFLAVHQRVVPSVDREAVAARVGDDERLESAGRSDQEDGDASEGRG